MKPIDLRESVVDYLRGNGYIDAAGKRLDAFTGKEGVCVRYVGHKTNEAYMDGSVDASYVYQIVVRRRSNQEAMEQCAHIAELLSEATLGSANSSYEWGGQEVYEYPQEMELSENMYFAWEVKFEAHLGLEGW